MQVLVFLLCWESWEEGLCYLNPLCLLYESFFVQSIHAEYITLPVVIIFISRLAMGCEYWLSQHRVLVYKYPLFCLIISKVKSNDVSNLDKPRKSLKGILKVKGENSSFDAPKMVRQGHPNRKSVLVLLSAVTLVTHQLVMVNAKFVVLYFIPSLSIGIGSFHSTTRIGVTKVH